jgi:hypothetical protein
MGLLYLFPVSEDEQDHVESLSDHTYAIHSYGLPLLFWGYLAVLLVFIFLLGGLIFHPLKALYATKDLINQVIAVMVGSTVLLVPLGFLSFFFYKKSFKVQKKYLVIEERLFGICFRKKEIRLGDQKPLFEIKHFLDSANIARRAQNPELRGFMNSGYKELYLVVTSLDQKKSILLDRNSRQGDLEALQKIIERFL